jgi:hypothetical protein
MLLCRQPTHDAGIQLPALRFMRLKEALIGVMHEVLVSLGSILRNSCRSNSQHQGNEWSKYGDRYPAMPAIL